MLRQSTKRRIKISSIIGLIVLSISAVVTLIAVGLTRPRKTVDFMVALDSPFISLNYNRIDGENKNAGSKNTNYIFQNAIEGFFYYSVNNQFDTEKVLGLQQFAWNIKDTPTAALRNSAYYASQMPALAVQGDITTTPPSKDIGETGKIEVVIKIRRDSTWSNGDNVGAEDFLDSIKYALDPASASEIRRTGNILKGYDACSRSLTDGAGPNNLKDAYKVQGSACQTFLDNSAVVLDAAGNRVDPFSYRDNGSYENKNFTIKYEFDISNVSLGSAVLALSRRQIFYPVNRRFIQSIGGYEKFGTSAATFISNGPYKVTEADFDYEVMLEKRAEYWDASRVFSKRISLRVIPDETTKQSLFLTGLISSIEFARELYPVYSRNTKVNKFIVRGVSDSGSLKGYFFNTFGPGAKYTSDPEFRLAISTAINREELLSVGGLAESPPADLYSPEIPNYKTGNAAGLRDFFFVKDGKGGQVSSRFTVKGHSSPFVTWDSTSSLTLAGDFFASRNEISKDYDYNAESARKLLESFEKRTGISGPYVLRLLFLGANAQLVNEANFLKQKLKEVFGDKVILELTARPNGVLEKEIVKFTKAYDLTLREFKSPLNTPFGYYQMLMFRPDRSVETFNESTLSLVGDSVIYNPFVDDSNGMINSLEKRAGGPSKIIDFLKEEYGITIIDSELWERTKRYISNVISNINQRAAANKLKGIDNKLQITNQTYESLVFEIENPLSGLQGIQSRDILSPNQLNQVFGTIEVILRISGLGIRVLQAQQRFTATYLLNSYTSNLFPYSENYRFAYKCDNPPKNIPYALPGCSGITNDTGTVGS